MGRHGGGRFHVLGKAIRPCRCRRRTARHAKPAPAALTDLLPDRRHRYQRAGCAPRGAAGRLGLRPPSPISFDALLRILDTRLRLITPTDPEGRSYASRQTQSRGATVRKSDHPLPAASLRPGAFALREESRTQYYQLTHDYLVPSLRDWLRQKLSEDRRGQAELLLADRAAIWNARPENRQLPSLLAMAPHPPAHRPQELDLGRAAADGARPHAFHALRCGDRCRLVLLAALIGLQIRAGFIERQCQTRAEGLVDELLRADIGQVPTIVSDLAGNRTWADPLLRIDLDGSKPGSAERLNLALALLPVDRSQVGYLRDQLLVVTPQQFPIVRDALWNHAIGKSAGAGPPAPGVAAAGPKESPVAAAADSSATGAKAPATQSAPLTPWWTSEVVEPLWQVALDPKRDVQPRSRLPARWPSLTRQAKIG